jgi:hypothetical protein
VQQLIRVQVDEPRHLGRLGQRQRGRHRVACVCVCTACVHACARRVSSCGGRAACRQVQQRQQGLHQATPVQRLVGHRRQRTLLCHERIVAWLLLPLPDVRVRHGLHPRLVSSDVGWRRERGARQDDGHPGRQRTQLLQRAQEVAAAAAAAAAAEGRQRVKATPAGTPPASTDTHGALLLQLHAVAAAPRAGPALTISVRASEPSYSTNRRLTPRYAWYVSHGTSSLRRPHRSPDHVVARPMLQGADSAICLFHVCVRVL